MFWWMSLAAAGELDGWQAACEAATNDATARVSLQHTDEGWRVSCGPSAAIVEALPVEHRARVELLWLTMAREQPATPLLGAPPPLPLAEAPPAPVRPAPPPLPVEMLPAAPIAPAPPPEPAPAPAPEPAPDATAQVAPPRAPEAAPRRRPAREDREEPFEGALSFTLAAPSPGPRTSLAAAIRSDRAVFRVIGASSGKLDPGDDGHWLSLGIEGGLALGVGPVRAEGALGLARRHEIGMDQDLFRWMPGAAAQIEAALGRTPLSLGLRADYDLAPTVQYRVRRAADGSAAGLREERLPQLAVSGALISSFGR